MYDQSQYTNYKAGKPIIDPVAVQYYLVGEGLELDIEEVLAHMKSIKKSNPDIDNEPEDMIAAAIVGYLNLTYREDHTNIPPEFNTKIMFENVTIGERFFHLGDEYTKLAPIFRSRYGWTNCRLVISRYYPQDIGYRLIYDTTLVTIAHPQQ